MRGVPSSMKRSRIKWLGGPAEYLNARPLGIPPRGPGLWVSGVLPELAYLVAGCEVLG